MFGTNSAGFFTNIKKKQVKKNRTRRTNVRTSKSVKTIPKVENKTIHDINKKKLYPISFSIHQKK